MVNVALASEGSDGSREAVDGAFLDHGHAGELV
jgi:hypothetical protein